MTQAKLRRYISSDHFSVDGTRSEAWASHKSFKPKDSDNDGDGPKGRNAEVQWHGQKRSNDTHASTTDPDARLYRKSNNTAAQLCYAGHLLIEHRCALIVDAELTAATGFAERDCAADMLKRLPKSQRRRTVAGDKNYDTRNFVAEVRAAGFTPAPRVEQHEPKIHDRRPHHPTRRLRREPTDSKAGRGTLRLGQDRRPGRKLRYIGNDRNRAWFKMTTAVYNLIRITALDAATI